jgi:hypothetical protein
MTQPIERMHRAQALLDDPMFQEAFDVVEKAIIAKLKAGASDTDAELLLAWRVLPKLKGWFVGVIQTGKIELNDEQVKEARKK